MKHADFFPGWPVFRLVLGLSLLVSCRNTETEKAQMQRLSAPGAVIWPDYTETTVPCNIAPLNFYVLPEHERFTLKAFGNGPDTLRMKGKHGVFFKESAWKKLLGENIGGTVTVSMQLRTANGNKPLCFTLHVRDSIDPFMVCRLIEPSYQTSSLLQSVETDLRDASSRVLFDNRLQERGCANCHTFAQNDGSHLVYHVRFHRTGTFIVRNNSVVRVDLKSERFPQGGVYPSWHPDKNLIAFGTASAYPFVHSKDIVRRTEVFDSFGDVFVYDIDRNAIFTDRRMSGSSHEETFPYWSWDGRYLYFCQASNPPRDSAEDDTDFSKKIKYSLLRLHFDEKTQRFGKMDTVIDARVTGKTVSFPRLSPDNRFLVFCLSDHGTFPIRHPESDLYLIDLQDSTRLPDSVWIETGGMFKMKKMEHINSNRTESYHTWSSNGKWLLFSSKREDGLYARPYFAYVDSCGRSAKPFLLPQKDPAFYLTFLKSYNVPELARDRARIDAAQARDFSLLPVKKPDTIRIDGV